MKDRPHTPEHEAGPLLPEVLPDLDPKQRPDRHTVLAVLLAMLHLAATQLARTGGRIR